jgi:gluconokinase
MSTAKVIVAIDIGSSSVRCSAYRFIEGHAVETQNEGSLVQALENCRAQKSVQSVQPNTGKIKLVRDNKEGQKSLMDNLDECMDQLLEMIRKSDLGPYQVVAVGFSAFVMNLVAVDSKGGVVGDEASVSYACNSPQVAKQCHNLRM